MFQLEIREHQLRFAEANPSSSYSHKEVLYLFDRNTGVFISFIIDHITFVYMGYLQDIVTICKRRGGSDARNLSHKEWLQSVQSEPDVISMSFVPITSLLNGVPGSGFLSHAINLYLRCQQHSSFSILSAFTHFVSLIDYLKFV